MFRLSSESMFYVVCPAFNKTGGTELAHQLVYELNRYGNNAIITYYGLLDDKPAINPAFNKYVNGYTTIDDVPDSNENIIIVPEIKVELLDNYKSIQKAIWWMSVDNYLKYDGFLHSSAQLGVKSAFKAVVTKKIPLRKRKLDNSVVHFYQSEYAKIFLYNLGITNSYSLSDYINETYFEKDCYDYRERLNNVLYNPKKGIKFTRRLIEANPTINWVPIENMTTEEVKELLLKSKVYIDFGNHPGKDRFPREAAISGCCVITGKRGSAYYEEDVPIGSENKFDDVLTNIKPIINRILFCLENYDSEVKKYDRYRMKIKEEPIIFQNEAKKLLE